MCKDLFVTKFPGQVVKMDLYMGIGFFLIMRIEVVCLGLSAKISWLDINWHVSLDSSSILKRV